MTDRYNKLVRDKIPTIIRQKGDEPITRALDTEEYIGALDRKLAEEVAEYLADGSVEELADIVEVIHAILACKGISHEELEQLRLEKRESRGGFEDRISLIEVRRGKK